MSEEENAAERVILSVAEFPFQASALVSIYSPTSVMLLVKL